MPNTPTIFKLCNLITEWKSVVIVNSLTHTLPNRLFNLLQKQLILSVPHSSITSPTEYCEFKKLELCIQRLLKGSYDAILNDYFVYWCKTSQKKTKSAFQSISKEI